MAEKHKIEVSNRWDAVALLHAFADRGSFVVQRGGRFEVFVTSDVPEIRERLRTALPRLPIEEMTVQVAEKSGHAVAGL
jgi:hypothetical protein